MASERARNFIEKANVNCLKLKLSELGLETLGAKAVLKLRLQDAVARLSEMEMNQAFPDNLLDTQSEDLEDVPEREDVDRELDELRQLLTKKQEIAELKRKISELTVNEGETNHRHHFNFRDIEESFNTFTGDDSYSIRKWINHFEESADLLQWDPKTRFIYGKRLMSGTAKLFVRTVTAKTWLDLKGVLLQEFDKKVSSVEIHSQLRKRKKEKNETWQQYVFSMLEIASLADMEECDVIQYIIKGIPDTGANKMLLYGANNIMELKEALRKYYLMKSHTVVYDDGNSKQGASGPRNQQRNGKIKCFNCNDLGHTSVSCSKPKRGKGSCFRCGKMGHRANECQESRPVLTVQNAGGQDHTNRYNNSVTNDFEFLIAFDFENNEDGDARFSCSLMSLLDSGSSISFVQQRFIPPQMITQVEADSHGFFGINDSPLQILGISHPKVSFKNNYISIDLYIVKNFSMRYPVVLGRDFISKNELKLKFSARDNIDITENSLVEVQTPNTSDFCYEILNIDTVEVCKSPVLNINDKLPHYIKQTLISIVSEAFSDSGKISTSSNNTEMTIRLSKNDPFFCTPRRIPFSHKEKLKALIDDLLKRGIIRESDSPYASPIVLISKKNQDELRLCIDYRTLNKNTIRDNYPLPLIEDLLDRLRGKQYFSALDLKSGFHHVKMAPDSIKYTSFVTPIGQFEYLRMPFGLKNAPSVFQRFIHHIFKDLIAEDKLFVYMDDILVATETIEEHFKILKRVIALIRENALELRVDKCRFLYEEMNYLGYIVNRQGIRPNEENLSAIRGFPIPKCIKGVHSFLGLASYFRKFIRNFALVAKPLYDLLKKDATFKFGEREHKAFDTLKSMLGEAPILAIYSPKNETELHCDASSVGFGSILLQRQADGKFHPVFYFSKRTTEVESRYHSYELETLSIIYALRRFRTYLMGIQFKIVSDCQALTLTLNKQHLSPRISRWALELQEYDYKMEHRPSNRMSHVDALSRCTEILNIEEESFDYALAVAQTRDPDIKEIMCKLEKGDRSNYTLINGLVYRKNNKDVMFYVPKNMEERLIQVHHESLCHLAVDKLYEYIRKTYWFPEMKDKIRRCIEGCLKCAYFSLGSGKVEGTLHNIPKGSVPFEVIHIDHFGPLPVTKNGYKHILVIIDAFTKFIKLYAVKNTQTKEVINCLDLYFNTYSRPSKIISDRGTCFTSSDFSEFCKSNNVVHIKVATHSPQSNGQVERVNRLLTPMLSKEAEGTSTGNWYKKLSKLEFAINNTVNRSTGFTPSQLLFGVEQKGEFCDGLKEYLNEREAEKDRDLNEIRKRAADAMFKSQQYNKTYYDKKHKAPKKYKKGDLVLIKNIITNPGINKKLLPKYRGPYEVVEIFENDRYAIKDVDGHQLTRLPYNGICSPANMKPYIF